MDGRQCQNKQHGDTVPKIARHVFMFSTDLYKKARQARFSTTGYVCSTQNRVVSHPAVELLWQKAKLCRKLDHSEEPEEKGFFCTQTYYYFGTSRNYYC